MELRVLQTNTNNLELHPIPPLKKMAQKCYFHNTFIFTNTSISFFNDPVMSFELRHADFRKCPLFETRNVFFISYFPFTVIDWNKLNPHVHNADNYIT